MYPGRLLLLGLIGASVVRTAPPTPASVQEHVETVQPRVVRGEAPPLPDARVTRPIKGPPEILTFNQNVDPRVIRGESPKAPEASVRRDTLAHTGRDDSAPLFFRNRLVAGDPPGLPESRIERYGGPATIVTFNQNVALRITRGDSPKPIGDRVERFGGPATVVTFNQNTDLRVTRGDGPELPGSSIRRDDLTHTGAEPPVAPTNVNVGLRVVRGETPSLPESFVQRLPTQRAAVADHRLKKQHRVVYGEAPIPPARTERWQVGHTGAEPPAEPANVNTVLRVVRGQGPPLPDSRVERIPTQRAQVADHRLKEQHRIVYGQAPVPEARIERWQTEHTGAEPPVGVENIFVRPRVVRGEAPPLPTAQIQRLPTQRAQIADHRLKKLHRVASGESPVPDSRIEKWGLEHTGAEPVFAENIFVGSRHLSTDYFEGVRVERWGEFHTGTAPVIQTTGGFLGRAFMN